MLAITAGEQIGHGLLGVLLSLGAFILWLFPVIGLGFLWTRLNRPTRERAMRRMIFVLLLLTVAGVVFVPSTGFEVTDDATYDNPPFVREHRIGLTAWFVERTTYGGGAFGSSTTTRHWSALGVIAILPVIAAMVLLARWQWRELPRLYRRPDGRCDWCNYDLTGSASPVCPECGETIT